MGSNFFTRTKFFFLGLQVSVIGLERALHAYTLEPSEAPFDLKSVPLATQPIADQKPVPAVGGGVGVEAPAAKPQPEKVAASRQDIYAGQWTGCVHSYFV